METIDRAMYLQKDEELQEEWAKHLKPYGVKLPKKNSQSRIALLVLFVNINKAMDIDEIKKIVEYLIGTTLEGGDPCQVRHFSTQRGFNIIKEGKKFKLVSMEDPFPGFIKDKRSTKLTDELWEKLKEEYDNMCLNCGSKHGEPMRWDKTKNTVLQQGHMDPRKPLAYNNCIPQCSFCNQQYKSKAIFNKRGFVIDYCKTGFYRNERIMDSVGEGAAVLAAMRATADNIPLGAAGTWQAV